MSRSDPQEQLVNPAKKFIKWNGDKEKGYFYYYDKETKENVILAFPVAFLVLDELATITGFEKTIKSTFYSNEVHRIGEEQFLVKCFNGKGGAGYTIATGLYSEIKDKLKTVTGDVKYTASIYAMYRNEKSEFELVNFHLAGSALNAWIELKKVVKDIFKVGVLVRSVLEGQNGAIIYRYPSFTTTSITIRIF